MMNVILLILSAIPNNVFMTVSTEQKAKDIYEGNYVPDSEDPVDPLETPDPNIEYEMQTENEVVYAGQDYENRKNKQDQASMDELILTKTLLNGTKEEIKQLAVPVVLQSLSAIDKVQISLNKRLLIWDIVKENKSVKVLKRSDLEKSGQLVLIIPEIDLYNLNYSDWDIIDYLGTLSGITRRRTGIIGYALKQRWGPDIITNVEYINRMKGILCAFSPQELLIITPKQFCQIGREVFQNIKSCTTRQQQVLIKTAKLTTVYGPIQAWNMTITARLALLIKSLPEEDLKLIRPEAMEGISYETISAMPRKKLTIFDEDQISFLDDLSLSAYRRLIGINSNTNNCCRKAAQISRCLCYDVILIFCLLKLV